MAAVVPKSANPLRRVEATLNPFGENPFSENPFSENPFLEPVGTVEKDFSVGTVGTLLKDFSCFSADPLLTLPASDLSLDDTSAECSDPVEPLAGESSGDLFRSFVEGESVTAVRAAPSRKKNNLPDRLIARSANSLFTGGGANSLFTNGGGGGVRYLFLNSPWPL